MAACDYCGTRILIGGKTVDGLRFCNSRCQRTGSLLAVSRRVPANVIEQRLREVHQGPCPKCHGSGPVDVHTSYRVWSALVLTSWSSRPHVSCKSCGRKSQLGDAVFSVVFGWWGFPWGLLMTPVQIVRNVTAALGGQQTSKPSPQLEKMLRVAMAAQLVASTQSAQSTAP